MTRSREDAVERTLRHMTENLTGAYNAQPPAGHPSAGHHCATSGTCILVCCYINALGNVLLKGGPSSSRRRDFERFHELLRVCMSDFMAESTANLLSRLRRGRLAVTSGSTRFIDVGSFTASILEATWLGADTGPSTNTGSCRVQDSHSTSTNSSGDSSVGYWNSDAKWSQTRI